MDLSSATMVSRQNDPYSFHDSGVDDDDMEMPSYRRDFSDKSQDDRETSQHSAKSRRKQAQPNRVQNDTDPPVVRLEPESPDHRREETGGDEPLVCSVCPEEFTNMDALRDHHERCHSQVSPESRFPTDYHRLGKELREKEEIRDWPADYTPEEGIPVDRRSGKKIFHQDAFCDLCDREFCNRYFLKTHLANKHGIYEDMPQYQHTQISAMYPPYLQGPPSMVAMDRHSPPDGRQSPLNMSITPTSISSPSKPNTPVSAQVQQLYGTKSPLNNEQNSPPKSPLQPDGSIDGKDMKQRSLDDFCELCQKHFCNKYYLRKHKMDVHGIHSEPYSAKRRHSSNTMMQGFGANPALLPQNIPPSMANIMLMNPFGPMFGMPPNPMFPIPHLPGQPADLPPHLKPPGNTRDSENSRSPGNHSEPIIKNPDAYCDICRKEFCDKYYLKVHKANMHNIQEDHNNSLPTFVPRMPPQIDSSRDIAREVQKMEMKNIERRESEKYEPKFEQRPENKLDRYEYDRMKYESRLEAEYEQRIAQAKQETKEEKKEDMPMDFSSHDYSDRRRTSPGNMAAMPMNLHSTPSGISESPSSMSMLPSSLAASMTMQSWSTQGPMNHNSISNSQNFPGVTPSILSNNGFESRSEQSQRSDHLPRKCEVCHKEFADKYALRVHRLNIHGLVHGQPAPPSMTSPEKKTPVKNERQTPPGYPSSPFGLPPSTTRSFGMDLPPSTIPMPKTSLGLPYPPSTNDSPMSTMFSSMVTAKLADRVTCDICHKEVCNKYFLKTHKIKMHGCDPASVGKVMKQEQKTPKPTPAVSPITAKEKLTELPRAPIVKPFSDEPISVAKAEELLRMGIDPEAYCEICKKEFCSKYFLRTHKLNMHGIPTDKPGNRKEDREISRREIMEREIMAMRELGVYPSIYPGMPGILGLPPPPVQSQYPFHSMPPLTVRQMDEESMDSNQSNDSKSSKSKREPANAIRVKCEICNKELCNRYFLRTHKLNKHGIVDDTLSEGQQRKLLELQQKGLLIENPMMIKEDGSIDHSEPRFIKREPGDVGIPLQASRSPSSNGVFSSLDNMMGNLARPPFWNPTTEDKTADGEDSNIFRSFTEVCTICQSRFTSTEWLETHMAVEHNTKNDQDTERMRKKMALACQACGMVFPDKIGLQIHLVQEHGVGINLTDEPGNESSEKEQNNSHNTDFDNNHISMKLKRKYSKILVKRKVYTCSKCEYRTLFIKNLQNHEERVHDIKCKRRFRCKNCFKRFRLEKSLRKHGEVCREESIVKKDGQMFCRLCSESFLTKRACRLHILDRHTDHRCSQCGYQAENQTRLSFHCRMKHGTKHRPALMPVNGHYNDEVNGGGDEKMPVCYSTPCDLKSQASFIMQPFTLRDENGFNHFVKAVVYLPVYQKINEPITVDFHLTPTDK